MKMKNSLLASLLIALASSATVYARGGGTGVGNGGDAVVCRSGGAITSVEFFDLFEGREVHGRPAALGAATLTVPQKVEIALARLRPLFPNLAAELEAHVKVFESLSEFTSTPLEDIPDSGEVIFPQGCKIEQAIIRSKTLPYPGKLYVVNADLWSHMDADNRVAAIFHEFLYGKAVDVYDHKNSVAARRLNAEILSVGPNRRTEWFDWMALIFDHKLGFDEPWGCWNTAQPANCNDPRAVTYSRASASWSPKDDITISLHPEEPVRAYSDRLGDVKVSVKPFHSVVFTLTPKGFVGMTGVLRTRLRLETPYGVVTAESGSFYREDSDELRIENGRGGLPDFPGKNLNVQLTPACLWDFSLSLRFSSGSLVESFTLGAKSTSPANCSIRAVSPLHQLSVETTELLEGSDTGYSITASAQEGHLSWIYGEADLRSEFTISSSTIGHETRLNAKGSEKLGTLPKYEQWGIVFENVPFSRLDLTADPKAETIETVESPGFFARIPLRPGLTLEGQIRFLGGRGYGRGYGQEFGKKISGDLRVAEMTGFSAEYFREIQEVERSHDGWSLRYRTPFPIRGAPSKWFTRYWIWENRTKKEVAFNQAIHPVARHFDASLITLTHEGQLEFADPRNLCENYTFGYPFEIETTTAGRKRFGKTILSAEDPFRFYSLVCFTPAGFSFDRLEVKKP